VRGIPIVVASALWLILVTPAPASAVERCSSFTLGPASFRHITATEVSCSVAKRLLDRTTLNRVRRGRRSWSYGGFHWRFRPLTASSARITGVSGTRVVRAVFAQG
jgi:hypothetical protein